MWKPLRISGSYCCWYGDLRVHFNRVSKLSHRLGSLDLDNVVLVRWFCILFLYQGQDVMEIVGRVVV